MGRIHYRLLRQWVRKREQLGNKTTNSLFADVGVLAPDEGTGLEGGITCFFAGSFFLEPPNQSLNSRASSPSRTFASRAFALSCRISSIVRVSRFTTLSFVRVFRIAEIRALIDCEPAPRELVSTFCTEVTSIAPPGSF